MVELLMARELTWQATMFFIVVYAVGAVVDIWLFAKVVKKWREILRR